VTVTSKVTVTLLTGDTAVITKSFTIMIIFFATLLSTLSSQTIQLPKPKEKGSVSLEEAISKRRSVRSYTKQQLTLAEVSQLLWAAQGITDRVDGRRAAPSAGALYPLEVYLVAGNVDGLKSGIYRYSPESHSLNRITPGDVRDQLSRSALGQDCVQNAAISIVLSGIFERTTVKYSSRGIHYVYMEAGHAGENICLQAVALNLGVVTVGAFYDDEVKGLLRMSENETPLYILPVGRK
jgi:SagB-type dehydrogenase family enzyme